MAMFITENLLLLHYFVFPVYSYLETATLNVSASVVRIGDNVTFECISPQGYTGTDFASVMFKLVHNDTELFGNEEAKSIRGDYSINWYTIEISGQQDGGNYTCIITTTGPEKTVSAGAVLKVVTDNDEDVGSVGGGKTESLSGGIIALIVILLLIGVAVAVAFFLKRKKIQRLWQAVREDKRQRTKDKEEQAKKDTMKMNKLKTIGKDENGDNVDEVHNEADGGDDAGNISSQHLLSKTESVANGH